MFWVGGAGTGCGALGLGVRALAFWWVAVFLFGGWVLGMRMYEMHGLQ